jgi:GNAT superfamily N-acetyltransferase
MLITSVTTAIGELDIIQATPQDVEAILSILAEAAQWIESKGIDQWRVDDFTVETILDYFKGREIFLAVFEGVPIGTFAIQWSDGHIWKELDNEESGYLHRFAVKRAYSGKGIGVNLLNWAEQYIRSQDKRYFRLDCIAENARLNQFYQTAGFLLISRVNVKGWNAALFEKELK